MVEIGVRIIRRANLIGRNVFQVSDIKRSYRIRGKEARTQIKISARIVVCTDRR